MSGKVERTVPLPAYVTVDGARYYAEGTIESLEAERDELRATVERYRALLARFKDVLTWDEVRIQARDIAADLAVSQLMEDTDRALNPEEEG